MPAELPTPCWTFQEPGGDLYDICWPTEARTRTQMRGKPGTPIQRATTCYIVDCSGPDCYNFIDSADDERTHFNDIDEAARFARAYSWLHIGGAFLCPRCAAKTRPAAAAHGHDTDRRIHAVIHAPDLLLDALCGAGINRPATPGHLDTVTCIPCRNHPVLQQAVAHHA